MTDQQNPAPEPETTPEEAFDEDEWRANMADAYARLNGALVGVPSYEFSRLFKAHRLLADPHYDDRPAITRALEDIGAGISQHPELLQALVGSISRLISPSNIGTGPFVNAVAPDPNAFALRHSAFVVMFIADGEIDGVDVFSEPHPTTTSFITMVPLCAGRGQTYDEARSNAIDDYEARFPELAKAFPIDRQIGVPESAVAETEGSSSDEL